MKIFKKRLVNQEPHFDEGRTVAVIDRLESVADRMEVLALEIEEAIRRRVDGD